MPLELHVWGPAFSLPSIDPQCLAAIAYFTQAVPKGEWVLIASSDVALSPSHSFPALRNGEVWIGGFRNIVDYVKQYSAGEWNLDADLDEGQKADCTAFSSFIETQGQALLDLSLYVSSANWSTTVRPLYSKILPLPLPYILPPSIRAAAKTRTEHLGLSSLDIDSLDPDSQSQRQTDSSIIPPSLRRPTATVSSLLHQSPEQASHIRLDSLSVDFFTPLQALRGKDRFFLSSSPTSLDCLALSYLSLALLPDLPSSWLADCMRNKFPRLCAFVHESQKNFFGGSISLDDAYLTSSSATQSPEQLERNNRARGKGPLPFSAPVRPTLTGLAVSSFSSILDHIPIISNFRQQARWASALEAEAAKDEQERMGIQELSAMQRNDLVVTIFSCTLTIGAFVGFVLKSGLAGHVKESWDKARAQGNERVDEEEAIEIPDSTELAEEMADALRTYGAAARSAGAF